MNMRITHLAIVFFSLLLLVSCTRCSDCELNGVSERVCEQDFDDPDHYNQAVSNLEADGYECVATL